LDTWGKWRRNTFKVFKCCTVKNGEDQFELSYKNKELHIVKVERNILQTVKRKVIWTDHTLHNKCLLKEVIEGKVEGRIDLARR
jgi:hypothetical protein